MTLSATAFAITLQTNIPATLQLNAGWVEFSRVAYAQSNNTGLFKPARLRAPDVAVDVEIHAGTRIVFDVNVHRAELRLPSPNSVITALVTGTYGAGALAPHPTSEVLVRGLTIGAQIELAVCSQIVFAGPDTGAAYFSSFPGVADCYETNVSAFPQNVNPIFVTLDISASLSGAASVFGKGIKLLAGQSCTVRGGPAMYIQQPPLPAPNTTDGALIQRSIQAVQ